MHARGDPGRRHPYATDEKSEAHQDSLTWGHTAGTDADSSPDTRDDALNLGQVLKTLMHLLLGPPQTHSTHSPPPLKQGVLAHWMLTSPTSFPRASYRDLGHPISCERYQPLLGNHKPSWPGSCWWEIPSQRLFDQLADKQLGKWKIGILLGSFRFF